jgi:hypothetical protein
MFLVCSFYFCSVVDAEQVAGGQQPLPLQLATSIGFSSILGILKFGFRRLCLNFAVRLPVVVQSHIFP